MPSIGWGGTTDEHAEYVQDYKRKLESTFTNGKVGSALYGDIAELEKDLASSVGSNSFERKKKELEEIRKRLSGRGDAGVDLKKPSGSALLPTLGGSTQQSAITALL